MTEISETEIKSMTKEQNYMRGYEDGKSDVLDKIELEIDKAYDNLDGYDPYALGTFANMVSEIIDKYRKGANE